MKDLNKRLAVAFPEKLKEEMKIMSKDTGIAQTTLVVMAMQSLIANYKNKGSFIFADLLNPDYKIK
ncbi:ribbon-helix-helix domain-containing protein [Brevibacillus laterosporus]|uniref:ribbon-helix-helix domain-containing protein n=1 Tax=Brevibacillus laterosporus TaxID=1465 RepID=UPI003D1A9B66